MGLQLVTKPTAKAVTLAEMRAWLKLPASQTDEDTLISSLIDSVTDDAVRIMERALTPATYRYTAAAFPDGEIELPIVPVISITSVKYYDTANAQQTIDEDGYLSDLVSEPGVVQTIDTAWPGTYDRKDAVEIIFVAGYEPDDSQSPADPAGLIPPGIRTLIMKRVAELYAMRSESTPASLTQPYEHNFEKLLFQYKNPASLT